MGGARVCIPAMDVKTSPGTIELKARYEWKRVVSLLALTGGVGVLALVSLVSLQMGIADISLGETADALLKLVRREASITVEQKIVLLLRLPRVVLAVLAGAALSVSGVVMQALTRNPLVSPFTIGVSSAAAFGASVAIVFGFAIVPGTVGGVVVNAFSFAVLCALLVYAISWKLGMSPETLILTGIALNYLFAALTSTVQYVAEEHQLAAAVQWAFGSLNDASWDQNLFLAVVLTVSLPVLQRFSLSFNALTAGGDELTKSIGANPTSIKAITGMAAVLLTASTISFTGVIGFVGLVGPHIARLLIGGDHPRLLPFSVVIGAILVVLADTIGRTLISPVVIPVGIVISFLGVPLFLSLIIARRTRYSG